MKNIKRKIGKTRDFLHSIAERTYPFTEKDEEGNSVYLDKAFHRRWHVCEAELGRMPNMRCGRIFFWREFLHLWVGILFWALAFVIFYFTKRGSYWALILPITLLVYFTIQEFVIDRLRYQERWLRSLIDWLIWGIPMMLFILFAYII